MIAFDSSVIVTAIVKADERHDKAMRAIHRAFDTPEGIVIPVHSLVETYAVITRMPLPHRATPRQAVKALRETFGTARLAPLSARSVWMLLDGLAVGSFGGGIAYDAIILKSAEDAGATALLTWNVRDYERLSPSIEIRTP